MAVIERGFCAAAAQPPRRHRLAPRDLEQRLARALPVPRARPAVGDPAVVPEAAAAAAAAGTTTTTATVRERGVVFVFVVERDDGDRIVVVVVVVDVDVVVVTVIIAVFRLLLAVPAFLLPLGGGGEDGGGQARVRRQRQELARVVGLDGGEAAAAATAAGGEDDEDEADEQEGALGDGHALLEDDLVGEDAEALAEGDDLALRLLALRLEGDDGRLPDLVVLGAHLAQLAEDGAVEPVEEEVHPGDLAPLQLGQRLLQEPRLRLDVLQRQRRVGLERLQPLRQRLEEGVLHRRRRGSRGRRGAAAVAIAARHGGGAAAAATTTTTAAATAYLSRGHLSWGKWLHRRRGHGFVVLRDGPAIPRLHGCR